MKDNSFSILGDSYSTFQGYIPEKYSCYYPNLNCVRDVIRAEDMWWHLLGEKNHMRILENNSYSGATVCTDVRDGYPLGSSYVERVKLLTQNPKYIIVFGCTNDFYLCRELGELQFSDWSGKDLRKVLPAYCYVLDYLRKIFPNAKIISVINTEFSHELHSAMLQAGVHYHATNVELTAIDKQNGHPTKKGMAQIAQQIEQAIFSLGQW